MLLDFQISLSQQARELFLGLARLAVILGLMAL